MKNSQKKVLPFPKPPEPPETSTIAVQIGNEHFAIHWKIEELRPPATAPVRLNRPARKGYCEERN